MSLFLCKPTFKNNITLGLTLFLIFVLSYVAMAWYDAFFDCRILPLQRGSAGVTTKLKPPPHVPEKQEPNTTDKLKGEDASKNKTLVYLMHVIIVVPLLAYIGIYRKSVTPMTYPILITLAVFTAAYHGLQLVYISH
tara:strand:- start:2361 stop:2771 length:411 start_codon:yes stop_codon:yes gene_type:complete